MENDSSMISLALTVLITEELQTYLLATKDALAAADLVYFQALP